MSAAVDHELDPQQRLLFDEHIGRCPPCRSEYELEAMTKTIVQRRIQMVKTPGNVVASVVEEFEKAKLQPPYKGFGERVREFFALPWAKPVVALSAALIVVVLAVNVLDHGKPPVSMTSSKATNNVIYQAISYYPAIVSGDMKPEMLTISSTEIKSFFRDKVDFEVKVLDIQNCDMMGSMISEPNGEKVAHVIYRLGPNILYLYQVNFDDVLAGKRLSLPEKAKAELNRTGWYVEEHMPDCNVIIWKTGQTLCLAVAKMEKNDLLALLKENKE